MINYKYKLIKSLICCILLQLIIVNIHAQNSENSFDDSTKINIELRKLSIPFFERLIVQNINIERKKIGLSVLLNNSILKMTATDQSSFMSDFATTEQTNPGERAIAYGGTRNISEIVSKISISASKKISYQQAAQQIIEKSISNLKYKNLLFDKTFNIVGVSVSIDQIGEKLYASIDLGNELSIAPVLDKSSTKYISTKSFGLELYNAKICNKCNKFNELNELAQHIIIEDNTIYFIYENSKKLKQLIKTPEDGFAVDIVNKNQFACNKNNCINYRVPNKGIILKPILSEEFFRLNTEEPKSNKIKVKLGIIPKEIQIDSVEFNLIVISQKIACKNLNKTTISLPTENKSIDISIPFIKENDFDLTKIYSTKKSIDSLISVFQFQKSFSVIRQFNCLCAYTSKPFDFNDADFDKINTLFDKVLTTDKINRDTIELLEIKFLTSIISNSNVSPLAKETAMNKLKLIDPINISLNNNLALFNFFANHNEYSSALLWLDDFILGNSIPENYLFSYISIATLFSDRVNSGTFTPVLEKAKTLNAERFCMLFNSKNFSFQLFENQSVKSMVCESCKK